MSKLKLLIVDDEPDIVEFLSYNFRKKGYEVFGTVDGISALDLLEIFSPDLIITDILMPNMNGIAMCKQIRNNERFKNIPVIFLSATKDEFQMTSAMEAGGDHYLSKPIKLSLLNEIVNDLLNVKAVI